MGKSIGRQQHRLVAGDRRHRREHVHALGPRDARNQLHREERRRRDRPVPSPLADCPSGSAVPMTTSPSCTKSRSPRPAVGIRAERPHLQHDVGRVEQLPTIGDDLGPRRAIGIVRKSGRRTRAGFHAHFAAELLERGERRRHQRHAPLSRKCLFGNGDNHGGRVVVRYANWNRQIVAEIRGRPKVGRGRVFERNSPLNRAESPV